MTRVFLFLLLGTFVIPVQVAIAQIYPNKPIKLIVPYPVGGGTDVVTRIVAAKLSKILGEMVVVENRSGAGGNIGTNAIAKAAPDGYTIGMATPGPVTVGRALYPTLPYDPQKDLAPVILVNESPIVLVLNSAVEARSVKELVSLAKSEPGKLNAALAGTGSIPHLLTEMLKAAAGINVVDIPYRGGGPALIGLMGGQVDLMYSVLSIVTPHIKSGKLRIIAIASPKRSALVPNVSTMGEAGLPNVTGSAWNGIVAPAGTPDRIISKLNAAVMKVLQTPGMKKRLASLGMEPVGDTPEQFAAFIRIESAKWKKVVAAANIKIE